MEKGNQGTVYVLDIEDHSDMVEEELAKAIKQCLAKMGENSVTSVTDYMSKPDFTGNDIVDSGRLRGSISFTTPDVTSGLNSQRVALSNPTDALSQKPQDDMSVLVGTNVEYAETVEFGSLKQLRAGRYYLRNGIEDSLKKSESDVESILKGEGVQ